MIKKKRLGRAHKKIENLVTNLVQLENERLTRLLRNLYQEFRLGRGDRSQIYEHICRELAQYFHCDCCQLYLITQERITLDKKDAKVKKEVREILKLVAAFGPWERAIKPKYVRRIIPTEYTLDSTNHTARRFRETVPKVDMCRVDYRKNKPKNKEDFRSKPNNKDVEWHLVWHRENLYSISRNILSCPIFRHRSKGTWNPYHVGLLKLENRRPLLSKAFESDWPTSKLYLGSYFELFTIAAFIKDLERRLNNVHSFEALFAPLHDADGWRQHFQEHPAGKIYFEKILDWQKKQNKEILKSNVKGVAALKRIQNQLREQYREVRTTLSSIMNLVVEVEVLAQELEVCCCTLWPLKKLDNEFDKAIERLPDGAPAPSLFNVIGLVKAKENIRWLQDVISNSMESKVANSEHEKNAKKACYDVVDTIMPKYTASINEDKSETMTLWEQLKSKFYKANNNKVYALFDEDNRRNTAKNFCDFLKNIAENIRESRRNSNVSVLTPALLATYQSADEVLNLYDNLDKHFDRIKRLAQISAAACMNAHTFDLRLDTTRLLSIQSHVSQIIDNYLMEKARLLDVGISFDHIEILGLTESSFIELNRFHKLFDDTCRCLDILIRGIFMQEYHSNIKPIIHSIRTVQDFLKDMVNSVLKSEYKYIDLIEIEIKPPVSLNNKMFNSYNEILSVKCNRQGILNIKFDLKEEIVFEIENFRYSDRVRRPAPYWLFKLNDALELFCKEITTGKDRKIIRSN